MADSPVNDGSILGWVMACSGVAIAFIGHLYHKISESDKLTRDGDAAIWAKMARDEELARAHRETMIRELGTKTDRSDLADAKAELLRALDNLQHKER